MISMFSELKLLEIPFVFLVFYFSIKRLIEGCPQYLLENEDSDRPLELIT
jgi:hypothetical protein